MTVEVTRQASANPKVAVYAGTKLATSTLLSHRLIALLADPAAWPALPGYMQDWLAAQAEVSRLPRPGILLAETFPRGPLHHLCLYGFAGRNAHQTLGLLLTRRMELAGLDPMGFVATDYALLVWGLAEVPDPAALLSPEGLREGLETWLGANAVMKRTFRNAATIAGLIEKNLPGRRKTGRQATFSSDILYDTLRKYDPDHLLLRITRDGGRPRPRRLRPHRGDARPQPRPPRGRPRPHRHPPRRAALPRDRPRPDQGPGRGPPRGRGRPRPPRRGRPRPLIVSAP